MAPEYAMRGYLSVKTDVFSFGILVLEIISGRTNYDKLCGYEKADLLSYVSQIYYLIETLAPDHLMLPWLSNCFF